MRRLFDVTILLDTYRPEKGRVYGYFAMPILAGGRVIGYVDPARDEKTLVAKKLVLDDPESTEAAATALREAAAWVGYETVRVERTEPSNLRQPLRRTLE